jgi:DNA transformation protein and related proteins
MSKNPFVDEVIARLRPLEARSRAMFGGHGLYLGESFFAVIAGDRLFFRVTDETRPDYERHGSGPFEYDPGKFLKSYFDVPAAVWEDDVVLREWAARAADRTDDKPKKRKR